MFPQMQLVLLVFTPTSEIIFKFKTYDLIRSSYFSDGKLGPGTSLRGLVSDIMWISSSSSSDGIVKCLDLSEYPVSRSLDLFFSQDFNSLRSSGYRLEEMVCGFVFHEYTSFSDDYFLFYITAGSLEVRKWCVFVFLVLSLLTVLSSWI